MRFSITKWLCAIGFVLFGLASVHAEEGRLIPSFNPFAPPPTSSKPIQFVNYDGGSAGYATANDFGTETYAAPSRTWTAGTEALILKPFHSEGELTAFDYDFGYRVWVGVQRADGLGVRARYFDYFQRTAANDTFVAHVFDAEVFDRFDLGCWTVVAGAGLRYLATANTTDTDSIDGFGPVATFEAFRRINNNLSFYGIGRYSILVDPGQNPGAEGPDICTSTLELQIGVQVTRQLQSGATLFGRVGWEAQDWENIGDGNESIVLIGASFSGGVIY